nr:molybdenum cofactor guanylyltransferase [Deinococcus wulumuqiensis]
MLPVDVLPATAAITAGGQSSRFGSDKALACWQGRTLLDHVAAGLAGCERRLLLAPRGRYSLPGWEIWPDARPGEGPLAGLETALTHASPGWVAFTGVDNPALSPEYWHALLAARRPNARSVQAVHPERGPQPLGALYHTDLLPHVTALLDAGERRLRLAAPAGQTVLVPGLPPGFFQNVNRPADLAGLSGGKQGSEAN